MKSEVDPRVSACQQLPRGIQCAQVRDRARVHPRPEREVCRTVGEEVDECDTIAEEGAHLNPLILPSWLSYPHSCARYVMCD